ncbi:hypothetical protein TVAG_343530 [Trichomonas vaginalis G3]|uniref:Uncharacterized protein n=1 Tax=Trichomonas vaginalis (strain ATCC PRA-98 / G3) TaxID=412133 RepID=A2E1F7_TRIV3|nr:armadillo (ARM) repeat-containing protein family [Trichomonas vaginalis G3]EAY13524.1 hypothetical protein TVAG_343530 [Trichomonas vaginalis G3]KAI5529211.1 armadillo (ARM) repeat-containing protein family [Trichomonas vaginalis G3]|eukprot:XP_001325747.1 hypothetical protein [Trichomonas vaginalis G3]
MTIESFNEAPLSFFACVYSTSGDLKFSYTLAYKLCSINSQFFEYLMSLPSSEANQRFVANLYSENLNFDQEILKDYIISALNAAEEPIEISTSIYLLIKCIDCFSDSELSEISNSLVMELFSMNEYDVILCMACKLCSALSIRSIELPADVIPILVELTNSIISKYSSKALCNTAQHLRSSVLPVASDILNVLFESIEIDLKSFAEEEDTDEDLEDLIRKRANSIIELLYISKIPIEDEKIVEIFVNLQNCGFYKKFIRMCIVVIMNLSPISPQIAQIIFANLKDNNEAQNYIDLYLEAFMQLILIEPAAFCSSINVDELISCSLDVFTTSKNFFHYNAAADMLCWCILQHCHGNNSQIIFRTVSEASILGNHQFLSDLVLTSLQIAGDNVLNEDDILRLNDIVANEYIYRKQDIFLFIELYSQLNNSEIVNLLKSQLNKLETLSKPEMDLLFDSLPLSFQVVNPHDDFPLKNHVN